MYSIAPDIKYISATPDEILELYRSTNESLVQIPGFQGENSEAFLITLNLGGKIEAYLYFFLKESLTGVVYRYTDQITRTNYIEVRDQGLYFLESMGFIMENTDFRKLPSAEKVNLMNSLPPFHADLSKFQKKSEKEEEENEEGEVVEVEVLEDELETIHEVTDEQPQIVRPPQTLTPENIELAMKKNRVIRVFLLFLAGF